MKKLTILIFSRNDAKKALSLISAVYGLADELVLVDSSDSAGSRTLDNAKRKRRLSKLRIFHTVALGMVEPLRMYGIGKCRGEWILYLDTDERPSAEFMRSIREIISGATCNAFAIRRYEDVRDGKITDFFTWNIRLYRKDSVSYKGILHEQPVIEGTLTKMDDSCYLMHLADLKTKGSGEEYSRMLKFDRLSYYEYNDRLADYLSKMTMSDNGSRKRSCSERMLRLLLIAYERLTLKNPEQELSKFDYFTYNFMILIAFCIKKRDFIGIFKHMPLEIAYVNKIEGWKREPDGQEIFEISKIIKKVGIIHFLDLDDEKAIRALNRKYFAKEAGVPLLVSLLKEKYEKGGRAGPST